MKNKPIPARTIGPVSSAFIATLQKRGKTIFSLTEAQEIYGKNRYSTGDFLSDLVKRGILARIKAGVYMLFQMGSENAQLGNWPVIARELAGKDPYFISHYSAMRIHGMTTHALRDVFITSIKRKKEKKIGDITYYFIGSKKEHFWGKADYWATRQEQVQVSDPERTILDGLDRPDLCGGLMDVVRGIWTAQKSLDLARLKRYAGHFRTKAALKRLGCILETLHIATDWLPELSGLIADAKGYALLDPQGPPAGKLINRWWLRINLDLEELKTGVWG